MRALFRHAPAASSALRQPLRRSATGANPRRRTRTQGPAPAPPRPRPAPRESRVISPPTYGAPPAFGRRVRTRTCWLVLTALAFGMSCES